MIPTGLTIDELIRHIHTTGESVPADRLKELLEAEYQRGYRNGCDDAAQNYDDGYSDGYDDGYSDGYDDGYRAGEDSSL